MNLITLPNYATKIAILSPGDGSNDSLPTINSQIGEILEGNFGKRSTKIIGNSHLINKQTQSREHN